MSEEKSVQTDQEQHEKATDEESNDEFFQVPCVICQEDLYIVDQASLVRTFSCGHKFHYACVVRGQISVCPLCRETVQKQRLCSGCYNPISVTYKLGDREYNLCAVCMINKVDTKNRNKASVLMVYNKNIATLEYNAMRIFATYDAGVSAQSCLEQLLVEMRAFFRGADSLAVGLI